MSSKNTVHTRDEDDEGNPAKRPRASSPSMEITSVNDDCLIAIFSHLSMADLAAVRQVSERFHYAADECFETKLRGSDNDYDINGDDYEKNVLILDQFGRIIRNVYINFKKDDPKCRCKFFLLLKKCTAMDSLWIEYVDFDNLSIDPLEIGSLKNVSDLSFCECSGTWANFERFFSAFDPLKLESIWCPPDGIGIELLGFIAERMFNLQSLYIEISSCTPLFVENLAKMQNLKKLKELNIHCKEPLPMEMLIEPLAKLESRCEIELSHVIIPDKSVAKAMNKLRVLIPEGSIIPEDLIDRITASGYYTFEDSDSDSDRESET